jgi:hypothetical protein
VAGQTSGSVPRLRVCYCSALSNAIINHRDGITDRRFIYGNSVAVADLGRPEEIGMIFAGFQKYLYQQQALA